MNEPSIIRTIHDGSRMYRVMIIAPAQNRELSFEARGMLWYLLSKPDDWVVQPHDLEQKCGRDKARSIINELIEAGHIIKQQLRGEDGSFTTNEYQVHELPLNQANLPLTENPLTAEPLTANPSLTYKRELQSIDSTEKIHSRKQVPTAGRRHTILSQINLDPEQVKAEEVYEVRAKVAGESDLARYVFAQIDGYNYVGTLDRKTITELTSKKELRDRGTMWRYISPVALWDEGNTAFRDYVEQRVKQLKAIPGMTSLNALKNICKFDVDPSIQGNERKMPGYHYWLQRYQSSVKANSAPAAVELGVPDMP